MFLRKLDDRWVIYGTKAHPIPNPLGRAFPLVTIHETTGSDDDLSGTIDKS